MKRIVNKILFTTIATFFLLSSIGCSDVSDFDTYEDSEYKEQSTRVEQNSRSAMPMTTYIGTTLGNHSNSTKKENFEKSGKKDSSKGDKGHHHFGRSDKSKHNK